MPVLCLARSLSPSCCSSELNSNYNDEGLTFTLLGWSWSWLTLTINHDHDRITLALKIFIAKVMRSSSAQNKRRQSSYPLQINWTFHQELGPYPFPLVVLQTKSIEHLLTCRWWMHRGNVLSLNERATYFGRPSSFKHLLHARMNWYRMFFVQTSTSLPPPRKHRKLTWTWKGNVCKTTMQNKQRNPNQKSCWVRG